MLFRFRSRDVPVFVAGIVVCATIMIVWDASSTLSAEEASAAQAFPAADVARSCPSAQQTLIEYIRQYLSFI